MIVLSKKWIENARAPLDVGCPCGGALAVNAIGTMPMVSLVEEWHLLGHAAPLRLQFVPSVQLAGGLYWQVTACVAGYELDRDASGVAVHLAAQDLTDPKRVRAEVLGNMVVFRPLKPQNPHSRGFIKVETNPIKNDRVDGYPREGASYGFHGVAPFMEILGLPFVTGRQAQPEGGVSYHSAFTPSSIFTAESVNRRNTHDYNFWGVLLGITLHLLRIGVGREAFA